MKDKMPTCAAFVAECREFFGAESINPEIRKGMHGEPTFYAAENGHVIGTKDARRGIKVSDMVIDKYVAGKGGK